MHTLDKSGLQYTPINVHNMKAKEQRIYEFVPELAVFVFIVGFAVMLAFNSYVFKLLAISAVAEKNWNVGPCRQIMELVKEVLPSYLGIFSREGGTIFTSTQFRTINSG